jgi:hypothetical protein
MEEREVIKHDKMEVKQRGRKRKEVRGILREGETEGRNKKEGIRLKRELKFGRGGGKDIVIKRKKFREKRKDERK